MINVKIGDTVRGCYDGLESEGTVIGIYPTGVLCEEQIQIPKVPNIIFIRNENVIKIKEVEDE